LDVGNAAYFVLCFFFGFADDSVTRDAEFQWDGIVLRAALAKIGDFFRDAVGVGGINLAADDSANSWERIMDRVFATLPIALELSPFGERRSEECPYSFARHTDNATCKRVSGIIGPLYLHKNMKKTHKLLHYYFGWGSVSILAQVGKFFEYERLVSADGANVYVTDENILRNLHMPIGLLHGNRNQVFDPESSERTLARINNIHRENCTLLPILGDYAHFDCLAGDRAYKDVFPSISDFLQGHVL